MYKPSAGLNIQTATGACGGFYTGDPRALRRRRLVPPLSLKGQSSATSPSKRHYRSVRSTVPPSPPPFSSASLSLSVMYSADRASVRSGPVDITATALSYNVESGRRYLKRGTSARWWWWWWWRHVAEVKCFAISVPLIIAMYVLRLIREEIRLPGFVNGAGRRGLKTSGTNISWFSRGCFERAPSKKELAK